MADIPTLVRDATVRADQAYREASPWIERLARLGYAALGVVYLIIGGLAAHVDPISNSGGVSTVRVIATNEDLTIT